MNDDMRVGQTCAVGQTCTVQRGTLVLSDRFSSFFLLLVPVCQSVIDIEPLTYQTRPRDYHGDRLMHAE